MQGDHYPDAVLAEDGCSWVQAVHTDSSC